MDQKLTCVLCDSQNLRQIELLDKKNSQVYFQCEQCDLIFLAPRFRLSADNEKKRYELHENDVLEQGYQDFVSELYVAVTDLVQTSAKGLDYGSGKSSAISFLLLTDGFNIKSFDPFFNVDDGDLVPDRFDYIVVCEVAEHFYNPRLEFKKLRSYLKPSGHLFILTSLKTDPIDFKAWSYRRDPTHVCFYSEKTFQWICEHLGFSLFKLQQPNLIVLQKKD